MIIDRCYCFDVTFERLKSIADEHGARTIDDLQRHCEFGLRCRLCHPYVRRMLRQGPVVFDHILTAKDEPPRTLSDVD